MAEDRIAGHAAASRWVVGVYLLAFLSLVALAVIPVSRWDHGDESQPSYLMVVHRPILDAVWWWAAGSVLLLLVLAVVSYVQYEPQSRLLLRPRRAAAAFFIALFVFSVSYIVHFGKREVLGGWNVCYDTSRIELSSGRLRLLRRNALMASGAAIGREVRTTWYGTRFELLVHHTFDIAPVLYLVRPDGDLNDGWNLRLVDERWVLIVYRNEYQAAFDLKTNQRFGDIRDIRGLQPYERPAPAVSSVALIGPEDQLHPPDVHELKTQAKHHPERVNLKQASDHPNPEVRKLADELTAPQPSTRPNL
ncbi:MAG: hypothetical protein GXY55_21790 [Phycisphaerae bacterium]|nr:hypothetical protein [Phycisphaerae bacterium]